MSQAKKKPKEKPAKKKAARATKKAATKKAATKAATKKAATKKAAAKKAAAKKAAAKKAAAKKAAAKKATAKKALKPKTDPRIELGDNSTHDFPCVPFNNAGDFTVVSFVCSAKLLYSLVQINRRQDDKEEGYQRALSVTRVADIARFVSKGGFFPTSIVVAFESDKSELLTEPPRIRIHVHPSAGWVIDGQHRLAGAHESEGDVEVPVVAFLGLSIEDQIRFFVTINKEQKGVPTSLYYDLLPHLDSESHKDLQKRAVALNARDLARALSADETSPFFARIVQTRPPLRGKELSLTNFIRKLSPLLYQPKGRLASYPPSLRAQILNNFYRAASQVYPDEFKRTRSFFFQTVGFGALIDALPWFMDRAIDRGASLQTKEFIKLFERIADFDLRKFEGQGTGAGTEGEIARTMVRQLQESLSQDSDIATSRIQILDDE